MTLSRIFTRFAALFTMAAAFTGCALVDEDLRDCETDYNIDYELRLVTNLSTELQTQLSMAADVTVSNSIRAYLKDVFTDFAHDVDLGFYDVYDDSTILHHESHIMDANQSSYTLFIPVRRYMHLALANISGNRYLSFEGNDKCHTARIVQAVRDTIPSHKSGFFTARLPMDIKEGEDQQFDVRLYMSNCASAVVIDTLGSNVRDIKVCMTGFATGFEVCDSVYTFDYSPIIKADKLDLADDNARICYAAVTFPSRTVKDTKTIIDWDDPFVEENSENPLWQVKVYSYLKDGKIVETVLGVQKPLEPGQLRVIKLTAHDNGVVHPKDGDPVITVSVEPDWQDGMEHQVPLGS